MNGIKLKINQIMNQFIAKITVIGLVSFLFLGGCFHETVRQPNENPKKLPISEQTRVMLMGSCPVSGTPEPDKRLVESGLTSALIGIVGPTLIQSGVGALGAAIKKAAGEGDEHAILTANTESYFYLNRFDRDKKIFNSVQNPSTVCIIFAAAHFGNVVSDATLAEKAWNPEGYQGADVIWGDSELRIIGAPKFYMEAAMLVPDNRGEFRIKPRYILYNQKFNHKGGDDKRDLEIKFDMTPAGGGDKKGSSESLVLLNVPVGHYMGYKELQLSTGFMSVPAKDSAFSTIESARNALVAAKLKLKQESKLPSKKPSDGLIAKLTREKCLHADTKLAKCKKAEEIAKLEKKRDRALAKEALTVVDKKLAKEIKSAGKKKVFGSPFEITVTVTETRDINKWWVAVGDALEQNKEAISDELANRLIPSKREATEATAQTETSNNNSAYLAAMLDVDVARIALEEAEKGENQALILSKKKELIQKKGVANSAAITAGKPIPFPELL